MAIFDFQLIQIIKKLKLYRVHSSYKAHFYQVYSQMIKENQRGLKHFPISIESNAKKKHDLPWQPSCISDPYKNHRTTKKCHHLIVNVQFGFFFPLGPICSP